MRRPAYIVSHIVCAVFVCWLYPQVALGQSTPQCGTAQLPAMPQNWRSEAGFNSTISLEQVWNNVALNYYLCLWLTSQGLTFNDVPYSVEVIASSHSSRRYDFYCQNVEDPERPGARILQFLVNGRRRDDGWVTSKWDETDAAQALMSCAMGKYGIWNQWSSHYREYALSVKHASSPNANPTEPNSDDWSTWALEMQLAAFKQAGGAAATGVQAYLMAIEATLHPVAGTVVWAFDVWDQYAKTGTLGEWDQISMASFTMPYFGKFLPLSVRGFFRWPFARKGGKGVADLMVDYKDIKRMQDNLIKSDEVSKTLAKNLGGRRVVLREKAQEYVNYRLADILPKKTPWISEGGVIAYARKRAIDGKLRNAALEPQELTLMYRSVAGFTHPCGANHMEGVYADRGKFTGVVKALIRDGQEWVICIDDMHGAVTAQVGGANRYIEGQGFFQDFFPHHYALLFNAELRVMETYVAWREKFGTGTRRPTDVKLKLLEDNFAALVGWKHTAELAQAFQEDKTLNAAIDAIKRGTTSTSFIMKTGTVNEWRALATDKSLLYFEGWLKQVDCIFPTVSRNLTALQKDARKRLYDNILVNELGTDKFLSQLDVLVGALRNTKGGQERAAKAALVVAKVKKLLNA